MARVPTLVVAVLQPPRKDSANRSDVLGVQEQEMVLALEAFEKG